MLIGRALDIWRKALLAGPAASLELTLETLKQDDGLEACVSVAWMPASALAASPRRFVATAWPQFLALAARNLRRPADPDHIIPTAQLDPLPVEPADRRDFETILATTRARSSSRAPGATSDGRLLGRSTLLHGQHDEVYLRRNAMPAHAFSETDRLMARPEEFRSIPQAIAAHCLLARLAARRDHRP